MVPVALMVLTVKVPGTVKLVRLRVPMVAVPLTFNVVNVDVPLAFKVVVVTVPDVTVPDTVRDPPTYPDLLNANPPADVNDPPLVVDVASVVLAIANPPCRITPPVLTEVEAVTELLVMVDATTLVILPVVHVKVVIVPEDTFKDPDKVPAVNVPVTVKLVPIYADFATANPPAVVMDPPFVEETASVTLAIPNPPAVVMVPVLEDVDAVDPGAVMDVDVSKPVALSTDVMTVPVVLYTCHKDPLEKT